MAFLNEVRDGQSIVAKLHRQRDDEPHVRLGELMKRMFVMIVLPAHGKIMLVVALQEGCCHRSPDEVLPDADQLSHDLSHIHRTTLRAAQMRRSIRTAVNRCKMEQRIPNFGSAYGWECGVRPYSTTSL